MMLKRAEIIAVTKRVSRRLAVNETGVAPLKEKHVQRFATLKQRDAEKRKGRKAAARS
jgi:hypothetical protein